MSPIDAEKIINEYGKIIASAKKGEIVQSVFSLPYSPAKIRYAHFVYAEALIDQGVFTKEIGDNLEQTYAMIDSRFVEDAEEVNNAFKKYAKDKDAQDFLKQRGGISSFMPSSSKMTEFHNFLADCYGNWSR